MSTIHETVTRFAADPVTAQTSPAATAVLTDGSARVTTGPFEWQADLPGVLGGGNTAPSPTAYLLGALAGCAVAFIADTLAPEFGVEVTGVRATARCRADLRALVGVPGAAPDLTDVSIEIDLDSPSDPGRVAALEAAWIARCPVLLALTKPLDVRVDFVGPREGATDGTTCA